MNQHTLEKERNQRLAAETLYYYMNNEDLKLAKESLSTMHVPRRSGGIVLPYKGIYGVGYEVHLPSWDGRRYSRVFYFVLKYNGIEEKC